MLNKEFSKKDVQRMRNLITGDTQAKTSDIIGYKHNEDIYNEGDIWEKDGKTWTIKDGLKQNITNFDKIKGIIKMPLFCPKCKKPLKNRNDKTFYPIHKMCFNCVIDFEAQLKREGKWDEYVRNIHNQEIDARIKEFNIMLDEAINQSNDTFVTEDGKVENWIGKVNLEKIENHRKSGIEYFEKLKK